MVVIVRGMDKNFDQLVIYFRRTRLRTTILFGVRVYTGILCGVQTVVHIDGIRDAPTPSNHRVSLGEIVFGAAFYAAVGGGGAAGNCERRRVRWSPRAVDDTIR